MSHLCPTCQRPLPRYMRGLLTDRELEVVERIASGLKNKHIAAELVIERETVGTHIRNIFRKLGVHSRQEVARWYQEHQTT